MNKHGTYELSHELPNDIRLTILGNKEKTGTSQNLLELQTSADSPCQDEHFFNTSQKLLKNGY